MSDQDPQAKIRGIPSIPSITEVNVRSGASTAEHEIVFKTPVGMSGLSILDVQPDSVGNHLNGKVYQWFKLQFHGGAVGWVRDDLLSVKGDLTHYGYRNINDYVFAFDLIRGSGEDGLRGLPGESTEDAPSTELEEKDAPDDLERVRRIAFLMTGAFEGGSYSAYNNYDAGIVSYGIIQFTLAAGSLETVLRRYLEAVDEETGKPLRKYMDRVAARDSLLRNDTGFRDALIAAGEDEVMRDIQDQVASDGYWNTIIDGYITPRDLRLPLSWALLFDMGVNFGAYHGFVRLAEQQLSVPPRSKPGENGISEQQLIERVILLRKQSHYKQADRDNLPGLKRRADFWTGFVDADDWYLHGVNRKINANGRIIDVMNP